MPRGPAGGAAVAALHRSLRLPEAICELLASRGFGDEAAAKRFLRPRLDQLHDPFRLAGMDDAVARLETALRRGETILVHGDYDVDGICSATLYTRALRALGGRVEPFVPSRLSDGYDLGPAGIRRAREVGASLILTGDCGILAHAAVADAKAAGIDVIVTDHHTPGATLPPAVAVVNPNRPDCTYPDKGLAGAGVAFKVCRALYAARGEDPDALLYHLDLVALATVADLAPLVGENRAIVRYGLRVLGQTGKPGLRALIRRAGLAAGDGAELTAGQVGHVLAPRINAVGRMSEASLGVELLLTESEAEADRIAQTLEEENRRRQAVDRKTLAEALELLERGYDPERDRAVVLAAEGWHPGVIGIVASRVVERIHRPTVLIALDPAGGPSRGSARSIRNFHLYEALDACGEHLERYGGHKAAAGLDILPARVEAFREAFNAVARERLSPDDLVAEVAVDLEIPLQAADERLYHLLRHFGPFGIGNPTPVFVARGVGVAGYPRVVGDGHLKLELAQDGARLGAIGFRMADRMSELDLARQPLDVAFQLQENRWNGRTELQAKLVDLRAAQ
ncbi:MAG TPA: single-stranded-DNA-specific exonuclease RecJ [Longimicrobiales bacterium]